MPRRFRNIGTLSNFGDLLQPDEAQEPILARPVRNALTEWLTEIWAKDELAEIGLAPRNRALFTGPPGVGKTTLAHHLAARLGLPMLAVRSDRIIDCWLGSTGRNIGDLFTVAASADAPMLLFFDEFDSLAQQRRKARTGAEDERNSATNVLLQRIENFGGFLIAASNRADEIDPAIWRRFDLQIGLELPGQAERKRIAARYLAPYALADEPLTALASALDTATPALIRMLCETLKRQLVIGPRLKWDMDKKSVFDRVLATVAPHPDLPKPPLWSESHERRQIMTALAWPLGESGEQPAKPAPRERGRVVAFPNAKSG